MYLLIGLVFFIIKESRSGAFYCPNSASELLSNKGFVLAVIETIVLLDIWSSLLCTIVVNIIILVNVFYHLPQFPLPLILFTSTHGATRILVSSLHLQSILTTTKILDKSLISIIVPCGNSGLFQVRYTSCSSGRRLFLLFWCLTLQQVFWIRLVTRLQTYTTLYWHSKR